jgi:hypothetical protein
MNGDKFFDYKVGAEEVKKEVVKVTEPKKAEDCDLLGLNEN